MTLSQAIIQRMKNLINQNANIENYHQLATRAGLNESVVRAILSGETKNPSTETMYYISVAFGITLSEFYNDKLFNIDNIEDN